MQGCTQDSSEVLLGLLCLYCLSNQSWVIDLTLRFVWSNRAFKFIFLLPFLL